MKHGSSHPPARSSRAGRGAVKRQQPLAVRGTALLAGAGLVALVLVTYLPVLDAGFITDDDINVTVNPTLYSVAGLRDMWLVPRVGPAVLSGDVFIVLARTPTVAARSPRIPRHERAVPCRERRLALAVVVAFAGAGDLAGGGDLRRSSGRSRIRRLGDRAAECPVAGNGLGFDRLLSPFRPTRYGHEPPVDERAQMVCRVAPLVRGGATFKDGCRHVAGGAVGDLLVAKWTADRARRRSDGAVFLRWPWPSVQSPSGSRRITSARKDMNGR